MQTAVLHELIALDSSSPRRDGSISTNIAAVLADDASSGPDDGTLSGKIVAINGNLRRLHRMRREVFLRCGRDEKIATRSLDDVSLHSNIAAN